MTKIKTVFKKLYIYVYSLSMALPVFALPLALAGTTANTLLQTNVATVSATTASTTTLEIHVDEEEKEADIRAVKIDTYFARHNLPLTGYGHVFVETADKYDLDYRLLPAIAMRESTGGKFGCPGGNKNVFGWASCKVKFTTYEEAIDKVGQHLSGNVKSTAGYYGNKDISKKLKRYNSVIPSYTADIYGIMGKIENMKVYSELSMK